MLDYKDILTKWYALGMSGLAIAKSLKASVSGVNDFLRRFETCESISFPLPEGITNYGIATAVYGKTPAIAGRDFSYEQPNYASVAKEKVHYTFVKNTIPVVAEEIGTVAYNTSVNEQRNKGAFVMDASSMDIETLLSHSQKLLQNKRKDGEK